MRKAWVAGVLIAAMLAVGSLAVVTPANSSPEGKISKPLGFCGDVFKIPNGSTVVHVKGGITEIYDRSGKLWLRITGEEVDNVSTPYGLQKATKVYQLPSGSFVKRASKDTVEVYAPSGEMILRVVNKEEPSVPAFSGWIEDAYDYYYDNINWFYAEWTCPTDPVNNWMTMT